MAGVRRLLIADAHVGQAEGDVDAMVDLVRAAAAGGVGELIYLGDGFQYLIGMSKFWTASVCTVIEAWRDVRQAGVKVAVVEGNRDFFLDAPELAAEIDWSGRRFEFEAAGVRYRLDHGDRVNLRDLQYRFWSRVSKSAPARMWARLLPRSLAVAIVRRMEARLAETNRRFRYVKPVADLERSARGAWTAGVDVLFWGHFHTTWRTEADGKVAVIIPAWLECRCGVLIEKDGTWRLVDGQLRPTTWPAPDIQ
jgi:UDP-2,3-diacylglucosamine pyrophosphatase LpxH